MHLRRLVPSAAIRRIDSGIWQRAGLARLFRDRRKPDVAQDERVRRGPDRHLERRRMEARVAALVEEVRDAPFLQRRHAVEHLEDQPRRIDALHRFHLQPVGTQDVAREERTEQRRFRRTRNDNLWEHDPLGILPAFIAGVVEGRVLESAVRTKRHLRGHREVLAAHGMPLPHRRHHVSVRRDGERLHLSVRDDRGVDERAVRPDSAARLRILRRLPFTRFDRESHADVPHRHRGCRHRRSGRFTEAVEIVFDLVRTHRLAARLHAEGLHVADPVLDGLGLCRGTRPRVTEFRGYVPENIVVEEQHVVNGKTLAPHAGGERLAVLRRRSHRLVHVFRGKQLVVGSEKWRALVSALHDLLRLARSLLDHRDELLEERRGGLSVVPFHELVHETLLVVLRIPEKVRRHVVPERRERPGGTERVPLLEHAHRAVLGEEANVRRDGVDVRMRHHVAVEVGEVVPDEEVPACNAMPVGEVLRKRRLVRRQGFVERTREVAFDVAEAHHHIGTRLRLRRRLARELVGERVDAHVRELLLNRLRDVVREAEVRPRRRTAVLCHHRLALLARAVSTPVVLRDLDEIGRRILAQTLQCLLDVLRLHLLVRKAELLRLAFPLHKRIPFRMLLKIHLRRQNLEE